AVDEIAVANAVLRFNNSGLRSVFKRGQAMLPSLPHPQSQSLTTDSATHSARARAIARPDSCFHWHGATLLESSRPPSVRASCLQAGSDFLRFRPGPDEYQDVCPRA